MTAKEVVINLIDKGLINGEEAFTLMEAIGNTGYLPSYPTPNTPSPNKSPYVQPWITWTTEPNWWTSINL